MQLCSAHGYGFSIGAAELSKCKLSTMLGLGFIELLVILLILVAVLAGVVLIMAFPTKFTRQ